MVQPLSAITSKVLDCTLRDGGYYTAWDFPTTIIERYLDAMRAARVDVVELVSGFCATKGSREPVPTPPTTSSAALPFPKGWPWR